MMYRTRVEVGSTGYVAYCGAFLEHALEALRASKPFRGEHAVCERREGPGGRWEPLVVWEGGKAQVCQQCGGTGDHPYEAGGRCSRCGGAGVE